MGASEKDKSKDYRLGRSERLQLAQRAAAVLLIVIITYGVGEAFGLWTRNYPDASPGFRFFNSLVISFPIVVLAYVIFVRMVTGLPKLYNDGLKLLQAGNYDQALEAFRQFYDMYDQNPGLERLHNLLMLAGGKYRPREVSLSYQAVVHMEQGNGPEAIRCYEQWLALNPHDRLA